MVDTDVPLAMFSNFLSFPPIEATPQQRSRRSEDERRSSAAEVGEWANVAVPSAESDADAMAVGAGDSSGPRHFGEYERFVVAAFEDGTMSRLVGGAPAPAVWAALQKLRAKFRNYQDGDARHADAKAAASGHARSTAGGKEAMHAVFREEISRALRTETRKWSRRRRKLSDWHVFRAKSWWEQANVAGHERRY